MKKSMLFLSIIFAISSVIQSFLVPIPRSQPKFVEIFLSRQKVDQRVSKNPEDNIGGVLGSTKDVNGRILEISGEPADIFPGDPGYLSPEASAVYRPKSNNAYTVENRKKNGDSSGVFSFSFGNHATKPGSKIEPTPRSVKILTYNVTSENLMENSIKDDEPVKLNILKKPKSVHHHRSSSSFNDASRFRSPTVGFPNEAKESNIQIVYLYDENNNLIPCPVEFIEIPSGRAHSQYEFITPHVDSLFTIKFYQLMDDAQLYFLRAGKDRVTLHDAHNYPVEWNLRESPYYEHWKKTDIVYFFDELENLIPCRAVYKKIGSRIEQLFELSDEFQLRSIKAGKESVTLRHQDGRNFSWNLRYDRMIRVGAGNVRRGLQNINGFLVPASSIVPRKN